MSHCEYLRGEECLHWSRLSGNTVVVNPSVFCDICRLRWSGDTPPESIPEIFDGPAPLPDRLPDPGTYPTLADMVTNFAGAMGRISKAAWHGKEVLVSEERFRQVLACCDTCSKWDGSARLGLGKCNHPGCGCTTAKMHLATEKCPAGGWDNSDPSLPIVCPFPKSAK